MLSRNPMEGAVGGALGTAAWALYSPPFSAALAQIDPRILAGLHADCAIADRDLWVRGPQAAHVSCPACSHNIKDYGHLIPGHGESLDRFDSMILRLSDLAFLLPFLKVNGNGLPDFAFKIPI